MFFLHQGLLNRGIESHLICSEGGELLARIRRAGLPSQGLPLRGEWDVASAWHIARHIRRRGVTVVHAHSSHAQMLGLLAARVAGCEKVVATRRVDFVPKRHPVNRWKFGRLSLLIVISRAIRDIMLAFGYPAERIRLVHSGVDVNQRAPGNGHRVRMELGIAPDELLVGNIAHMADHKGQRYFLDAMPIVLEKCSRARFVIVGEGELESRLRRQAAALGLGDRVLFPGFRADVDAVMDSLDVFVMPSHLEGLGTIVMDALAAEKPVVATRAGGIPEIIQDGTHGLLVRPRDPAALATAICRLLDEPDCARRLAAEGRRRVATAFHVDAMVDGNLRVYEELEC